jgi:hypothetical protein
MPRTITGAAKDLLAGVRHRTDDAVTNEHSQIRIGDTATRGVQWLRGGSYSEISLRLMAAPNLCTDSADTNAVNAS